MTLINKILYLDYFFYYIITNIKKYFFINNRFEKDL